MLWTRFVGFDVPTYVDVFFGSSSDTTGTFRAVARATVHPAWNLEARVFDVGFIELTSPAPADIAPIPFLPTSLGITSNDVDLEVRFVGFGIEEDGASEHRLEFTSTIAMVCASEASCGADPELPPQSFVYDHSAGGPCSGDSGGPSLLERDGITYVGGITTNLDTSANNCTESVFGLNNLVDPWTSLIEQFSAGEDVGPTMGGDDRDPIDSPTRRHDGDASSEHTGCAAAGHGGLAYVVISLAWVLRRRTSASR
jgi:hypothetical protein